ncbi:MAG: acylneuraminate cytidylyltransferase family protein [Gammaproteobacteria bacterium]|nr:acylneuraminate cytidylyltransferase family protein [Gammaproteobacteria bacterium]
MKNSLLTIIPARGGSKSIPRKNLALLGGRPLISYTLDICKSIDHIGPVLVSTDNEDIADYCAENGFPTSYRRPHTLASDEAGMTETVIDGLKWYEDNHEYKIEDILVLQPTSPFRRKIDVVNAIEMYFSDSSSSLISVTTMREHPFECIEWSKEENSWSYLSEPTLGSKRRQDYKGNFGFIDGSIYIASKDFIKVHDNLIVKGETSIYLSSDRYAIDIDEPEDLALAEQIIKSIS